MKRLTLLFLFSCLVVMLIAQVSAIKPPTIAFHTFYNDFNTAQFIRTSSLTDVLNKKQWSSISDMQMGFGFDFIKGITRKIDFVSVLDGSETDYLFKNGTFFGSNQFLLDMHAGLHIKLLTDHHTVVPYLTVGAGFSNYQGKLGAYIPIGSGLQFNIIDQAFVFVNMQYRHALSSMVNDHFQYALGIGVSIIKKKPVVIPATIIPAPTASAQTEKHDSIPVMEKVAKDILITVSDEQTGLPLTSAEVTITGPEGKLNAFTDSSGLARFNNIQSADYGISASLNGINTDSLQLTKAGFNIPGQEIKISLTHNDPRFTLSGVVSNKNTRQPEADVLVTVENLNLTSSHKVQRSQSEGRFEIQIEAGCDFSVSGKKAGYISNLEKISTKGLNRSATLYVQLEIGIEQVFPDKNIILSNIYYDKQSAAIRPSASSDLEKLVRFLKDNPALKIEIDSYTDSRGSDVLNLHLSQARAEAVVNYLLTNGIDKNRLIAKGFGASKLVNGCKAGVKCTEAQHEQNRRTEFKVVHK